MKTHDMKKAAVTASILAMACYGSLANAHNQGGSFNATSGTWTVAQQTAAVDYYQVTCSNDGSGAPLSLQVLVADVTANTARVSALVNKGTVATFTVDAVDTDAANTNPPPGSTTTAGYSPAVSVNGGAGVYNVFVAHSAAGTDAYNLQYHCMTGNNGTGAHTGTAIATKQNQ